jgi:hypothetical protein
VLLPPLPIPIKFFNFYMKVFSMILKCLQYNTMGWPLFPCLSSGPKAKAPLTDHGFKDASTDWKQIERWYNRYPDCAWGCATSSERAVLDVDPRNGGSESLALLIAEHGPLPPTPRVRTGSGGYHYYFRCPQGTKCGKPYKGIDRKAEGGYVIVPPSKIAIPEHQGSSYTWVEGCKPWEIAIADAPAWFLTASPTLSADAKAVANPWIVQASCEEDLLKHQGSPEGERRKTLCRLVGVHLARADSEASILTMAEQWAERCTPPFDEWEKHVDGLMKKEQDKGQLIPSFQDSDKVLSTKKPSLSEEAYHGLLGEMLRAIEPETEADPAGILLGWLACFGSIVGKGSWVQVGPRQHHPALFVGIVGRTSDAKGDSWAACLYPFRVAEPQWASICIANGVGSGEGLVERIADDQTILGKDGTAQVIPGATDKRCLLRLSELSGLFKRQRRENATLSEHLREAWDGETIAVPNRKGNDLMASDYAVSLVGDITPMLLRKLLETGSEAFDGFANRFLWVAVQRSRFLPSGGSMDPLTPFLERLKTALAFAKSAGALIRDADANALWESVYPELCLSGDSVPHTDRARPYVLRLSMLYALAACSKTIRLEHLRSALAVWDYCRCSARLIFSSQGEAVQDPLWLRLLNAITNAPGIKREELTIAYKNRMKAAALGEVLTYLESNGLAYRRMVQPEGGGRPAERWYPAGSDGDSADNTYTLSASAPASPWIVCADTSKEVTNSAEGETCADTSKEVTNSAQAVSGEKPAEAGVSYLLTSFPAEKPAETGVSYLLTSFPAEKPAETGVSYLLTSRLGDDGDGEGYPAGSEGYPAGSDGESDDDLVDNPSQLSSSEKACELTNYLPQANAELVCSPANKLRTNSTQAESELVSSFAANYLPQANAELVCSPANKLRTNSTQAESELVSSFAAGTNEKKESEEGVVKQKPYRSNVVMAESEKQQELL